jgi:hypothetical protein
VELEPGEVGSDGIGVGVAAQALRLAHRLDVFRVLRASRVLPRLELPFSWPYVFVIDSHHRLAVGLLGSSGLRVVEERVHFLRVCDVREREPGERGAEVQAHYHPRLRKRHRSNSNFKIRLQFQAPPRCFCSRMAGYGVTKPSMIS